jgi:hypothetical protein
MSTKATKIKQLDIADIFSKNKQFDTIIPKINVTP